MKCILIRAVLASSGSCYRHMPLNVRRQCRDMLVGAGVVLAVMHQLGRYSDGALLAGFISACLLSAHFALSTRRVAVTVQPSAGPLKAMLIEAIERGRCFVSDDQSTWVDARPSRFLAHWKHASIQLLDDGRTVTVTGSLNQMRNIFFVLQKQGFSFQEDDWSEVRVLP